MSEKHRPAVCEIRNPESSQNPGKNPDHRSRLLPKKEGGANYVHAGTAAPNPPDCAISDSAGNSPIFPSQARASWLFPVFERSFTVLQQFPFCSRDSGLYQSTIAHSFFSKS